MQKMRRVGESGDADQQVVEYVPLELVDLYEGLPKQEQS